MSRLLPMLDPFDAIKQIYYSTTRETIERDMERALELLRQMPDDETRQRAAGLMHGLTDLRREWKPKKKGGNGTSKGTKGKNPSLVGGAKAPPAQPRKSGRDPAK